MYPMPCARATGEPKAELYQKYRSILQAQGKMSTIQETRRGLTHE